MPIPTTTDEAVASLERAAALGRSALNDAYLAARILRDEPDFGRVLDAYDAADAALGAAPIEPLVGFRPGGIAR